jgi:hypothetical protein
MKTKTILLFTLAIIAISANVIAQNVPSYIPTNGLVGWWPFNGNANDESGNGNDGVVNGATLTTDRFGVSDVAYRFISANNNYVSINNNPVQNGTATISGWFNPFTPIGGPIFHIGSDNSTVTNCNGYFFGFGNLANPYGTNLLIDASCHGNYNTGWNANANNWYHFILMRNQNNLTAYINGNVVGTYTSSSINSPSNNIFFGSTFFSNSVFFNGKLDDIAIWNRALTPQEITALYTASNNNNATSNTTANVPSAISYQAVARDAQGMPLADANLQVRFTLIADSLSGTAEYIETHTLFTNSLGLFTTAFGAGTPVSSTFGSINWSAGNKFLQVQIDTGNGWMDMGTQQLLSTPYSMHSATSGAIKNPGLPVFADNTAALAGGLVAGDMYRTASGDLKIVY